MKTRTCCFWGRIKHCMAIGLMAALLLCAAVPAYAAMAPDEYVPDDTDGTEMQLMEPAQLELYFGPEWAGAQFTLETDVGGYPGTIPVSNDGTVRMEIGGSHSYVLRLVSTVAVPPAAATSTETETVPGAAGDGADSAGVTQAPDAPADTQEEEDSGGIPVVPIICFLGGLVIAVGVLIGMRILSRRRVEDEYDDEEEDG